jgi:F-type H+-transporting ATPase subunit delta
MTFRAIARRYAGALFDVGEQKHTLERIAADLRSLREVVASHPHLQALFDSALVSPKKKRAVVDALIASAHGLSTEVARLLELLADRDRLHLIGEIAELFDERLREKQQVVQAEITTAAPLTADSRSALTRALGRAGGTVELTERVDPAMIGGVTARVGSVVFDGSLRTQLERMRQRLQQQ